MTDNVKKVDAVGMLTVLRAHPKMADLAKKIQFLSANLDRCGALPGANAWEDQAAICMMAFMWQMQEATGQPMPIPMGSANDNAVPPAMAA